MRHATVDQRMLFVLALVTGCVNDPKEPSSNADGGSDAVASDPRPLLPWAVGNSWTYRVTDTNGVMAKVTEIGEQETVGGDGPHKDDMAFKVTTTKKDGTDQTISWQLDMDGRVVRYREQSFSDTTGELTEDKYWDPYKLRVDSTPKHTKAGATWLEEYGETKLPVGGPVVMNMGRDRWTVENVNETLTVPAGTFKNVIVLTLAGGSTLKTYWYAHGVGKLKETGGQTEELVSYQVSP